MLIKKEEVKTNKVENPRGGNGVLDCFSYLKNEDITNNMTGFNIMEMEPGSSVGYHQHIDDEEIYFILSGEGKIVDNGEESDIKAGDLLYTKQGERHSIKNTGNETLKFVAFIVKV